MKLLVILPRVPYPTEKGDKLRAFHQLRILSKYHDIVLCSLYEDDIDPDAKKVLKEFCTKLYFFKLNRWGLFVNMLKALFSCKPFQVAYFYRRSIKNKIETIIEKEKPDHIYCQLLRTAEYVKNIDIPKTIDYQDVFSIGIKRRMDKVNLLLRPVFWMEYVRLRKYENKIFSWFDNKTIISYPDRDLIPHENYEQIHVIPNGVDYDFFTANKMAEQNYDIVFTGNMNYPPNIMACLYLVNDILPLVNKTYPNCSVLLAGATPHAKVKQLKSENVAVSGWLHDIRDAYNNAKIFIAPMQIGTGLQNKLLEAMSMQKPCITTALANNALKAIPDEHLLIGNNAQELADCIVRLLNDAELCTKIGNQAREFILENYSWEKNTEQLSNIIINTNKK